MTFDLRLPIGLLFAVFGVILALDGLVSHRLVLDINVNLWWGIVLIVFGALMLFFALRVRRVTPDTGARRPPDERPRGGH